MQVFTISVQIRVGNKIRLFAFYFSAVLNNVFPYIIVLGKSPIRKLAARDVSVGTFFRVVKLLVSVHI